MMFMSFSFIIIIIKFSPLLNLMSSKSRKFKDSVSSGLNGSYRFLLIPVIGFMCLFGLSSVFIVIIYGVSGFMLIINSHFRNNSV